jgi:hypothetical protein
MAAFTDPTNADWSALAFIRDEIVQSLNERWNATVGFDWNPLLSPTEGDDVQSAGFINSLFFIIEDIMNTLTWIGNWVDHEAAPNKDGPVRMTYERFIEISGLYDNSGTIGWRRTTVHPTDPSFTAFEYGQMQGGDIIGPWIFEDLQKACAALKWTLVGVMEGPSDGWRGFEGNAVGYTEAKASAISAWSSQGGVNAWTSRTYQDVSVYGAELYGGVIEASAWVGGDVSLDYEYDVYTKTTAPTFGTYTSVYGFIEDEYVLVAQGIEKGDSFQIGDTTTPPWPSSDPGYTGCKLSGGIGVSVIKWAFSNGELPA